MALFRLTLAASRRNKARIPRRDFAISTGEDARFKVRIESEDSASATNLSGSMRLALWPAHLHLACDYGWGSLRRHSSMRVYAGAISDDGHALLRLSGRSTADLCGRWNIALMSRNATLCLGVLEVEEGPSGDFEPGLFVLDHSALDGPDVLPARVVAGVPQDVEGFAYV